MVAATAYRRPFLDSHAYSRGRRKARQVDFTPENVKIGNLPLTKPTVYLIIVEYALFSFIAVVRLLEG
jgi:hypothetical protein